MFTDRQIQSLSPKSYCTRYSEELARRGGGRLVVEVTPKGDKVFYFQFFRKGEGKSKRVFVKIGTYKESAKLSGITLAEARSSALEMSSNMIRGQDPKLLRDEAAREQSQRILQAQRDKLQGTFGQLLDSYLGHMLANGKRSHKYVEASFKTYVRKPFPHLMVRKANEIEADDIRTIIARMINRGITTHSNTVRANLHAAFQHGLKQDNNPRTYTPESARFNLKYNPVAFVPKQSDYVRVGNHVISDPEIRIIWEEFQKEYTLAAYALKLAFATGGQRVGELLKVPKSDVNLAERVLLINQHISKNSRDHVVPLNDIAVELLTELEQHNTGCNFIFPSRRGRAVDPNGHLQSNTVGRMARDFCANRSDIRKFIPRDIRRTVKTAMGRAGIDKSVRDRLQNHAMNDVSSRHYDRYDYLPEKRAAVTTWNNFLQQIINPSQKVLPLVRKAVS